MNSHLNSLRNHNIITVTSTAMNRNRFSITPKTITSMNRRSSLRRMQKISFSKRTFTNSDLGSVEDSSGPRKRVAVSVTRPRAPTSKKPEGTDDANNTSGNRDGAMTEPTEKTKKSHKDIEKRRRETISNGIAELSEIVPGALGQKKGIVVEKAIEYLTMLKSSEHQSAEKWRMEKAGLDEQITGLRQQADELKCTNDALRRELSEYS
ncbi:UNVERIFIED_CONTAM: basic helix-loop-helix protein [Siphonaria sp. JEL0065]|nr:basic helix-loop-helix protein [Siphonaria sp. JEL0065]